MNDLVLSRADNLIARARASLEQGGSTGVHFLYVFENVVERGPFDRQAIGQQ